MPEIDPTITPNTSFERAFNDALAIVRTATDANANLIKFALPPADSPEPWAVRVSVYVQGRGTEIKTVGTSDGNPPAELQKVGSWREASVTSLCSAFATRATTPEQLAAVAGTLLDWAGQNRAKGNQVSSVIDILLHKGLAFEANGGPSAIKYFLTVDPNDPSTYVASKNLDVAFNRLFTKDSKGIDPEHLVKALAKFDAARLIPDRFWSRFALNSSVECPQILPLLCQKVNSPNAAKIWEETKTQEVARSYMASILAYYADDPTRDQARAAKLLQRVMPSGQHGVLLATLINTSNDIVGGFNAIAADAKNQPLYPIELLDPKLPERNAAAAFLRALYITRDPRAPDDVKLAQHAQDELYAGVVAFLCERRAGPHEHRVARALASMILERPEMTSDQAEDARRILLAGGDFVTALSAIAQL